MSHKFMIIVLAVFTASTLIAQLSPSDQAVIDAYRAAIRSAENGGREIEAAFSKLISLTQTLTRSRGAQGAVLEAISAEEFEHLRRDLPGVLINREEVVFVKPDPNYFANLARTRGDAADRAFFSTLKATYPEAVWPVYVEQQTDYSGCTRFGSGTLVDTYRAWSEFQRRFPTRYVAVAKEELDEVIAQLTESTCACGNTSSIQDELQRFLKTFQTTSPVRTKVNERLQALRGGRSSIRTNCKSG